MRNFMLSLGAASLLVPAIAMVAPAGKAEARHHNNRHYDYKEWRGRDGRTYCRKSDGTTGTIVGAVGGALIGRTIDTRGDRTVGTLGGAVLGGLAGRAIDKGGSDRHCR